MDRHTKTHLLPEWPYISPTGIKMVMDDPVHSDWLLSGGIDLLARWDEDDEFQLASHRKMAEIQKKLFGFECAVLSTGTGFTSGDVVLVTDKNQKVEEGSIVVLKNATEEFESQMRQATKNGTGGVIVENGSKVAHLALVGRESNIVMMRLENAFETLKDGDRVLLDNKNGKIEIIV